MSLDLSHGNFHIAYGGFNRWRTFIAEVAGYELHTLYEDPYGAPIPDGWTLESLYNDKHAEGNWDEVPSDPLLIIFTHYEDDGHIKSRHCQAIADRLIELMPKIIESEDKNTEPSSSSSMNLNRKPFSIVTARFVESLLDAAAGGEDLEFK